MSAIIENLYTHFRLRIIQEGFINETMSLEKAILMGYPTLTAS
ncbi:MAG TPA: hypothetical protein VFU79_02075 [Nitrososphaeraceae archaeon]|nr:hypothetical protein [Nitrososphaeraceae archaeon]